MSDALKWALLAAAIISIIAVIVAFPLGSGMNLGELSNSLGVIVHIAGSYIIKVRNFINCFLTPFGRVVLSGIIGYVFFKWIYTNSLKIILTIYHWIFK